MLTEGMFKILGGNNSFITYICNSKKAVKEKLYPENIKSEIEKHLTFYSTKMKPNSARLIKMIVHP